MSDKEQPRCCLVFGCRNISTQGMFIGELCAPCHYMLKYGQPSQNKEVPNFVSKLYNKVITLRRIIKELQELQND